MKRFIQLFFLLQVCLITGLKAQDARIEQLKNDLSKAGSQKEKSAILYDLGKAYSDINREEAVKYARQSFEIASTSKIAGQAALSSTLIANLYEGLRDYSNMERWLKSSIEWAKTAKDLDLLIKNADKMSQRYVRERDFRNAHAIMNDAFTYLSSGGRSISGLQQDYDSERRKIEQEKAKLQAQLNAIENDLKVLEREKGQLSENIGSLTQENTKLEKDRSSIEKQYNQKDAELQEAERKKQEAEISIARQKADIEKLSREALEQKALSMELDLKAKESELKAAQTQNMFTLAAGAAGILVLLSMLFYGRYRISRRNSRSLAEKNTIIEEERKRSDDLLLNILPQNIAAELKKNGKAAAQRFNEVSVFFSDFKNFTHISETLSPEELVAELDYCFRAFDSIIGQYPEIEKIKTIGDAYMCATGLAGRPHRPDLLVKASLEIQEFLEKHKQDNAIAGKPLFEARIGIHTGPVVAGVVGAKKFVYDIWGDSVNTASRMEAQSQPGRINISETTYQHIRYQFACHSRGKIEAKNKGYIDMYYVDSAL